MKKILSILCLIALCGSSLFAQKIVKIGNVKVVRTPVNSQARVAAPDVPTGLKQIFGNLGPRTNAYNASLGTMVAGPLSTIGSDQFLGLPFTPKVNAHVWQLRVAVLYLNTGGANQVNLSLYTDAGGIPGTLIGGPVTVMNVPPAGTCCALAIANLTAGVAVTAGTRYWVVADTPLSGTGSDFEGSWNWVIPKPLCAIDGADAGWYSTLGFVENPAGAVFATVP